MEKIDKEKILEMLCSKDIELRQLGKSVLEQNYEIPSYLYICYYNDNYKFSLSNVIYNQTIRSNDIFFIIIKFHSYYNKKEIKEFIETIIEYNGGIKKE